MKNTAHLPYLGIGMFLLVTLALLPPRPAIAHGDTLDGPVVVDARAAPAAEHGTKHAPAHKH